MSYVLHLRKVNNFIRKGVELTSALIYILGFHTLLNSRDQCLLIYSCGRCSLHSTNHKLFNLFFPSTMFQLLI